MLIYRLLVGPPARLPDQIFSLMNSTSPPLHFVIPCAGVGSRAGTELPKQYAQLAGKPLIAHTLNALLGVVGVQSICLVVSAGDTFVHSVLANHVLDPQSKIRVIDRGGETRAQSVLAGIKYLESCGVSSDAWVLVHDAARCLITPQLVDHLVASCCEDTVGGLLAVLVSDTVKEESNGRVERTLSRKGKWFAQTPQMFKLGTLARALQKGVDTDVGSITDEASAIEALGMQPLLVKGHSTNLKITYPEDFEIANALLSARHASS